MLHTHHMHRYFTNLYPCPVLFYALENILSSDIILFCTSEMHFQLSLSAAKAISISRQTSQIPHLWEWFSCKSNTCQHFPLSPDKALPCLIKVTAIISAIHYIFSISITILSCMKIISAQKTVIVSSLCLLLFSPSSDGHNGHSELSQLE